MRVQLAGSVGLVLNSHVCRSVGLQGFGGTQACGLCRGSEDPLSIEVIAISCCCAIFLPDPTHFRALNSVNSGGRQRVDLNSGSQRSILPSFLSPLILILLVLLFLNPRSTLYYNYPKILTIRDRHP